MFDLNGDGFISNSDAYRVLQMLVPGVSDVQLQRLVDRAILEADDDHDGKLSFDEFAQVCRCFFLCLPQVVFLWWFIL